ncbi:hypothetical protein BAUCODRAFT_270089 [Baudoinia panamericana UAMH 10762]|uniref:Uncharacterized protein n=1 Tax=Baudoinia panamericana (strain UAMH 10762) TaxID=717646 RepID=M2MNI8_BAUPA|nr:uncharacterized protein BAUCODRAFT_270089 [Baudoinia panamericana UAMH 10762]EMC93003.1 hypothetical protein BAUCODRAFT_270089 [Baudoinia panamericana UAMH 10762]
MDAWMSTLPQTIARLPLVPRNHTRFTSMRVRATNSSRTCCCKRSHEGRSASVSKRETPGAKARLLLADKLERTSSPASDADSALFKRQQSLAQPGSLAE